MSEHQILAENHNQDQLPIYESKYCLHEQRINPTEIEQFANEGWQFKLPLQNEKLHFIAIKDKRKGSILAFALVASAAKSEFQNLTKIESKALANCLSLIGLWHSPQIKDQELLTATLYFALRKGRIHGKENIVCLLPRADHKLADILRLKPLPQLNHIDIQGQKYIPVAQRLRYAIYNAYELTPQEPLNLIKQQMGDELIQTHKRWLKRFFDGPWANSVINGEMTKDQYINSLFNLHQYVRLTTRLCARCVAHSDNMILRNNYIHHLKGEINHEILIERDLKKLGADVEYLKHVHVPDQGTKEFMVVQESTIGYYQDPVLMLACPMAAEGMAAAIKPEFVDALHRLVESWGVTPAKEATLFLTSHVIFDGGEDGHWQQVINMIQMFVNTEPDLQKFLSVYHAAKNGFEHGFNANIHEMQLWSAKPK